MTHTRAHRTPTCTRAPHCLHPRTRSPHFLIRSVPLAQKQAFYAKHDPSKTQDEIRELVRKYKKGNPSPPPPLPTHTIFSLYLHTRALQPCVAPGCISMQSHKQANSWSCVADSTASTASILHRSRLPSLSSDALLFVLCFVPGFNEYSACPRCFGLKTWRTVPGWSRGPAGPPDGAPMEAASTADSDEH